jgi:hypothetical protein
MYTKIGTVADVRKAIEGLPDDKHVLLNFRNVQLGDGFDDLAIEHDVLVKTHNIRGQPDGLWIDVAAELVSVVDDDDFIEEDDEDEDEEGFDDDTFQ